MGKSCHRMVSRDFRTIYCNYAKCKVPPEHRQRRLAVTSDSFINLLFNKLTNISGVLNRRRHAARRTTAFLKCIIAKIAHECGAQYERERRIDLVRRVRHKAGRVCVMHGHVDCLVTLPRGGRIFIELDRTEKTWSRRKLLHCARERDVLAVWIRWRGKVQRPSQAGEWGTGGSPGASRVCVIDMCDGQHRLRIRGCGMRMALRRLLRFSRRAKRWSTVTLARKAAGANHRPTYGARGPSPPRSAGQYCA